MSTALDSITRFGQVMSYDVGRFLLINYIIDKNTTKNITKPED